MIGLRHDGSLEREFSGDGYRRFATRIQYIAADQHGRLFVLGDESQRQVFYRLLPDGNRDRLVGGATGQHLGIQSTGQLADLVSLWHGRPLLYFKNLGELLDPRGVHRPGGTAPLPLRYQALSLLTVWFLSRDLGVGLRDRTCCPAPETLGRRLCLVDSGIIPRLGGDGSPLGPAKLRAARMKYALGQGRRKNFTFRDCHHSHAEASLLFRHRGRQRVRPQSSP